MKVTVIIPSLVKNKDYLKVCVDSLRRSVDWDIIVVTNGEGGEGYLNIDGITQRMHTKQQGQCNAVNIGTKVANPSTDYYFIVNDDMYFPKGWNKHLEFRHLVFSPNLIEPTNNAGSAPPFIKLDAGLTLDEFKPEVVDNFVNEEPRGEETGFNFPVFIRKDVWDTIGGYDTEYDPWGSNGDTDLQAMIHLAGIQTMRVRDVLVYHFSNKSGTFDGTHQAEWQHNFDYFTEKFGFNRDTVPGCDVWYSKNIIPEDKSQIKLDVDWIGKFK